MGLNIDVKNVAKQMNLVSNQPISPSDNYYIRLREESTNWSEL